MARDNIRNFCIIAHIDHGKSTLSDRILELTDSVDKRTMEDQILDDMELERERGITIKARAVTMHYHADDGKEYEFNLIDTPGHVDFQYEVSRSLAACEGAILVVDASQGVEAQTLANCYLAIDHNLEVVPILNKIDLPSADPDAAAKEVEDVIGLPCMDAPRVSAKMGINIREVLERVVQDVPAPQGDPDAPLKALIFDSIYDSYKGVIVYVRVFEGTVRPGDTIKLMNTGATFQLVEVGHMGATALAPCDKLEAGEVGYLTASIKTVRDTRVGDTITLAETPTAEALPGFRQVTPMVFCGIYPADGADYPDLKDALEKLQLNDAALSFEPETSAALGFGFRCGFLGLLHMEIITERLEREFDLDLITTTPGVQYRLTLTDGTVEVIDNPSAYPDPARIAKAEEPFVDAHIYTPNDYVGPLMDLCQQKRGTLIAMDYLDETRVDLHYQIPLGEIVYDFFDAIKSRSRGYASYDYAWEGWHQSELVKLDFLLNGEIVDALSMIVFADNAYAKGRRICEKLKENGYDEPISAGFSAPWAVSHYLGTLCQRVVDPEVLAKDYTGGGDFSDPAYIEALNIFKKLGEYMTSDPCSVDHEFARNAFIMGVSPMCYMQLAEMKYLRDDEELHYGFFNFPAVEDGKGDPGQLTGAPEGMMISATAKPEVQEAAIKFMEFVISKEGGHRMIAECGEISCVKGAWDETNCDEKQLEAIDLILAATEPAVWQDCATEATIANAFMTGGQLLLTGDMTAEDVMASVQTAAAALK